MNAKKVINFHYNQANHPQAVNVYPLHSQHIIPTTKVLKFTYQNTS